MVELKPCSQKRGANCHSRGQLYFSLICSNFHVKLGNDLLPLLCPSAIFLMGFHWWWRCLRGSMNDDPNHSAHLGFVTCVIWGQNNLSNFLLLKVCLLASIFGAKTGAIGTQFFSTQWLLIATDVIMNPLMLFLMSDRFVIWTWKEGRRPYTSQKSPNICLELIMRVLKMCLMVKKVSRSYQHNIWLVAKFHFWQG